MNIKIYRVTHSRTHTHYIGRCRLTITRAGKVQAGGCTQLWGMCWHSPLLPPLTFPYTRLPGPRGQHPHHRHTGYLVQAARHSLKPVLINGEKCEEEWSVHWLHVSDWVSCSSSSTSGSHITSLGCRRSLDRFICWMVNQAASWMLSSSMLVPKNTIFGCKISF